MRTTLKLTEIVEEWVSDTDILPSTRDDYRRKIGQWFRYLVAHEIDPRDPERRHVLAFKESLSASKSLYTVNSLVTIVKLFYGFCARRGYCQNIAEGIRSSRRHREYSKLPLTADQAFRLLNAIDPTTQIGRRDRLMISLMLFNGLRTCEVERIDIGDFDKREGVPVLYVQRKGRTEKDEMVVLHERTVEWLEEYVADRDFDAATPLFVSHRGKCCNRLVRHTISHIVKARMKHIGVNDAKHTAHSLRHTYGCLMVEQGYDIETIKDMMGHSDAKTTRIYVGMAHRRRLLHHSPSCRIGDLILKTPGSWSEYNELHDKINVLTDR